MSAVFRPSPSETEAVLIGALRPGERLERWQEQVLSARETRRVVRYHLRVGGREEQLIGKYYDQQATAQKTARVLAALASSGCQRRGNLLLPRVIAYHAPYRLLLLSDVPGQPVLPLLRGSGTTILAAAARALSAVHATPVMLDAVATPAALLADMRAQAEELARRVPAATPLLEPLLVRLGCEAPAAPEMPRLVHGDFGPAQLLWHEDRPAILDFDKATLGDPALDLGNLLAQLRRRTLLEPAAMPAHAPLRASVLAVYPGAAELGARIRWYEEVVLLRKAHFLMQQPRAALALLRSLGERHS
ncbi:MAG TPA: phosphotransferase [Haliangiales bacterium]|nr:phosphotransferase [Haliangiales bacterium]